MDYEKAYKEALARAKDVHDYYCDDNEQIWKIESIFPELKEDAESEDERMIDNIIGALRTISITTANKGTYKEELAWLEKQKEQKPVEWSEEDEKAIDAACALLCEYAGYYREKDMEAKNLQLFKVSQRLKSLCPQYHGDVTMTEAYKMGKEAGEASHWKPSEEQMKALQNAVALTACDKELARLYNQLKKL